MTREVIASARRVVVKIGSSSLTSSDGGVDEARVAEIVGVLATMRELGRDVVLVSSGAIATGFRLLGLSARPRDLATQQASASVGQGALVALYARAFATRGITVGQVLLTADDMTRHGHYRNAQRTLGRLLELGVIPIVNENDTVATAEIRLGDNDRLAALVSHLVDADALILLSDVDGLFDGPPDRPGARLVSQVRGDADLHGVEAGGVGPAGVGLGGMATKVEAARIATAAGIPVVLAHAGAAQSAVGGAEVGTFFHPTGARGPSRRLWLRHATTPQGRLVLDGGAVEAVVDKGASLLPAGILAVEGQFTAGDPVDLLDQNGTVVARGLVNFDAAELPSLLGRSTRDLARDLGPGYQREVVHRDGLVVL